MPARRTFVVGYLLLLALSTLVRWRQGAFAAGKDAPAPLDLAARADALVVPDAFARIDTLPVPMHLIAFETGGPAAIRFAAGHPDKVKSLTLVDADGIVEFDLLGDHALNQVLRRAQVVASDAIRWGIPHFGALDHGLLRAERARALLATDRRDIRALLAEWNGPTLILIRHGGAAQRATAREHARLLPQAIAADWSADRLRAFLDAVDAGVAPTRATATPERRAAAERPFDAGGLASAQGTSLVVVLALLALTTLLSEDLACVAAGVLAARGSIPLWPGIAACYVGIVAGDQLLYLLGRSAGRALVTRIPFRWILPADRLDQACEWFRTHGMKVVLTSRFLPGTRSTVYVAAGILRAGFARFALYLVVIGAVWTPALVGLSYQATRRGRTLIEALPGPTWPWALAAVIGGTLLFRSLVAVAIPEGRAGLTSRWRGAKAGK
jgi:membrane protein DedA with SNARE-associated domain